MDREHGRGRREQLTPAALDSRPGQQQLGGECFQAFHALLGRRFLKPAVPVERDWGEWVATAVSKMQVEIVIGQAVEPAG